MKGKYVRQNSNFENPIVRVQDSCLWKSLTDALHSLNIYDFWAVGNGNSVSAWHDRWLFPGKSIEEFGIVIPDNMQQLMVKDLVNDNGFWKLDILSSWLPQNIISKLFAIVPPNNDSEIDRRAWSGSPDGNFTIASAYTLLCRFNDEARDAMWLHIWRLKVPERVRSFVWLVRHDRLLTNYRKSKMQLCEPWCNHCMDIVEDTMHVLRDCPLAKGVWCNLLNATARDSFYNSNLEDWICMNLHKDPGKVTDVRWGYVWAIGCHVLWLWRNRDCHGDTRVRPTQLWQTILNMVQQYQLADTNNIALLAHHKVEVPIGWNRPEGDWIKLNTDGASRRNNSAGCGGLLRNSNGQWLGGFSRHLGTCNAYIAELWGVLDGLKLAYERGFKKIELHIDSNAMVQTLQSTRDGSVVGWRLIHEIRRLLAMDWEVKICHSYREANACADALANLGCDHGPGLHVYNQCPPRVSSLLLADVMGITTPRIISL
ncbi:Polynucleotidyl transferase, ribonuclease H superfamily protein [Trifolium repens]|nr:Polynucleotidyl transferase, ribonuclease H superfamily protein [Trifolium repens]